MPELAPDELFDSPPQAASASPPEAPARSPSGPELREQVRRPDGTFGHQHPAYLLEQARDYGVPEEDIAEFTSDQLGRAVNIARRLEQRRIQQEATRQSLENRPPQPPPAPPPVPSADEGEEYEGMDEVHEPIRKAFKDVRKQNQELRKRLEEQDSFIKQQRAQADLSAENRLDDAFAELSDYLDRIGDGPARSVKPGQFKVRGFLLQLAGIDTSKPLPSDKHLSRALKKAAEGLFGEAPAESKANDAGVYKNAPTVKDWQRGQVQRPSGRKGAPEPDGEAKAVANLTQKMREMGALPGQSRSEILDGLPD